MTSHRDHVYLVHTAVICRCGCCVSRSRLAHRQTTLDHTPMRIRVSTVPPLLATKVWSSLSSLPSAATVGNLKHSLCTQVPALKGLRGDQIQLFVDDFELLDTLPIDAVQENDLVQ